MLTPKAIRIAGGIVWLTLWVALFFVFLARTGDNDFESIVTGLAVAALWSVAAFFIGIYAPARILYNLASPERRSKLRLETGWLLVVWLSLSYFLFSVVAAAREREHRRDVEMRDFKRRQSLEHPTEPDDVRSGFSETPSP